MQKQITIFLLGLTLLLTAQQKINAIEYSGLQKTKPAYLSNFIQSRVGQVYDSLQVQEDVQTLRNLRLFWRVDHDIFTQEDSVIITFRFKELITLLPIVNFGGVSDNFWFQLGGVDYNWRGNGNTLGGYYRYYDRHSLEIFLKMPTIFAKKWGFSANLAKLSTIEPAYFNNTVSQYNVDHWAFINLIRYNISRTSAIEVGGGYLKERYEKNIDRNEIDSPGPNLVDFNKYLTKLAILQSGVDYHYHYLSGLSNELYVEYVKTEGEKTLFWKMLNIAKLYFRTGKSGNVAFRMRLGISTNKNSPFVPFVLDNYISVRGSGNRSARGTAELTVNNEYRHSFIDRTWGAVQGVLFIDMSAWRPAGGSFSDAFQNQNNVTFGGVGLRLHLRKINNFVLRLDYGVSVTENKGRGIVFGAGQYF